MPTRYSGAPAPGVRTLVLVRHGRTAWNAARRAQGHLDVPLDDLGRRQAAAMASVLAGLRPTRLVSSDLQRAWQTAEAIAAATGLAVQPDPRLREYSVGVRGGLTIAEFEQRFPREYAAWRAGDESVLVDGAESTEQVLARVVPALQDALAALGPGQTGVVVSHGACLRAALLQVLDLPQSADDAFVTMGNGTWSTLTEVAPGGRLRLAGYNEGVQGHDFASDDEVG